MTCVHLQQLYKLCQEHELKLSSSDLIRLVCNQCGYQEVCPSALVDACDAEQALGVDHCTSTKLSKSNAAVSALDFVIGGLMTRYRRRVPDVDRVIRCMIVEGIITAADDIENDHIAFRTMGVPQLGIRSLEKIFLHFGYERRDHLTFPEKKLNAYWYAPPSPKYPRVFISELRVNDLGDEAQRIVHSYADEVRIDPVDALDLNDGAAVDAFLHKPLWRTPTWSDYGQLIEESEYAAWVIYNRYYLNHFTISVHQLPPGYDTIGEFNSFLKRNGIRLNDAGGEIKVSADGLLLQSSTVAEIVEAEFRVEPGQTTTQWIAGSYVEFAERRALSEFRHLPRHELRREHRRDGFEVANADKIFESTYRAQVQPARTVRGE